MAPEELEVEDLKAQEFQLKKTRKFSTNQLNEDDDSKASSSKALDYTTTL